MHQILAQSEFYARTKRIPEGGCSRSNQMMHTIDEIRRANLELLIKSAGSIQKVADKVGRSHSQISQIKTSAKNTGSGKPRAMGDGVARDIELAFGLERGWMDHAHAICDDKTITIHRFDLEAAAGPGRYVNAMTRVESVRLAIDLAERIQRHAGVALASLALITVSGDSMEPTLRDGDMVVIDCRARAFERDGVYVFTYGDDTFIKRLQRMPNVLRACSDNKLYDPWDIADAEGLHVHGRVVWVWGGREV